MRYLNIKLIDGENIIVAAQGWRKRGNKELFNGYKVTVT